MAKHNSSSYTREAIEKMTLERLNHLISHYQYFAQHGGASAGRRAFFKTLVFLEAAREDIHDIPAKKRKFGR